MNGIIVVDKPADWTSHDVIAKLRGVLREKRIGHGGTLDPMATGVLPVFLGRATRAAEFCENAEKEYVAVLRLGVTTDTQDITGNVLTETAHTVTEQELLAVLPAFKGAQKQIPPMYSAVKIGGKKLYELARRGAEVERPARDIFIRELELLHKDGGGDYTLRIVCSKGTYIRALCGDIGTQLGCGGIMAGLRRVRAGIFTISESLTLAGIIERAALPESFIKPVDTLFSAYPTVTLGVEAVRRVKNGAACAAPGAPNGKIRVYAPDGEFLALGESDNGIISTVKSFFEI